MEQVSLNCPATGDLCQGKNILNTFIVNAAATQAEIPNLPVPRHFDRCQVEDFHDSRAADLEKGQAALRRDLGATCTGRVCAPLVQAASRQVFGGLSYNEALQLDNQTSAPAAQTNH
ncbi:MAG TPA: hypothetical protein VLI54_01755 [Bacillota bacterium]|nr:hypothetical protein [Bacillota bacterium]